MAVIHNTSLSRAFFGRKDNRRCFGKCSSACSELLRSVVVFWVYSGTWQQRYRRERRRRKNPWLCAGDLITRALEGFSYFSSAVRPNTLWAIEKPPSSRNVLSDFFRWLFSWSLQKFLIRVQSVATNLAGMFNFHEDFVFSLSQSLEFRKAFCFSVFLQESCLLKFCLQRS